MGAANPKVVPAVDPAEQADSDRLVGRLWCRKDPSYYVRDAVCPRQRAAVSECVRGEQRHYRSLRIRPAPLPDDQQLGIGGDARGRQIVLSEIRPTTHDD